MDKELALQEQETALATQTQAAPRGFEDEDINDVIIPRIKLIQDLSPERKEKIAAEGDLVNSLTKEILTGKSFVPVFKYDTHIRWIDRSLGGGIACMSKDGKTGNTQDGKCLNCKECGATKFDNTKTGKDAQPLCTAYMNFFGFIEGEHIPLVASFSKTYYNEGKKMYSMAKFRMTDMWAYKYNFTTKLMSKNDNSWYIMQAGPGGKTTAEDMAYAESLYDMFKGSDFRADLEDGMADETVIKVDIEIDDDMASEI
jgi:hypothetical protein